MVQYKSHYTHLQGLFLRTTRNIASVPVEHFERAYGQSGYTFNKLISLWSNIMGYSIVPLRIATRLGVTLSFLSIIAAVLSSNVDTPIESGWCMAGEVGLSGEVRPINRIEQRIAEAEKLGFTDMIIPKYNLQGFDAKKYHIALHPVRKVEEALRELFG